MNAPSASLARRLSIVGDRHLIHKLIASYPLNADTAYGPFFSNGWRLKPRKLFLMNGSGPARASLHEVAPC